MKKNNLIRKIRFISKFLMSQPGYNTITIHTLSNISRNKTTQTIKFGQLKEYNHRNVFIQKSCLKSGR